MQNIMVTEDTQTGQADRNKGPRHSSMPVLEQRTWLTLA